LAIGFSLAACGGDDGGATTVSVTGVTLNESNLSLSVGGSETLTATVAPTNATNKVVAWSSSNSNVATVSDGSVIAIAKGTATITVTTADGNKTAHCAVTVTQSGGGEPIEPFVAVDSITNAPTTTKTNEDLTLTGTVNPSNATNKTITWTIKEQGGTNSTLNENVLTAQNPGVVKITATIANGKTESTNYAQDFDVTITQFVGATHTVTFLNWNGATLKTQEVNEGSHATAPDAPERIGHTFSGWDKSFNSVVSDLTVTAQFTINQYSVTFKLNGGSIGGSGSDVVRTVNYGSTAEAPTNPTRMGYSFNNWDKAFTNVASDLIVTAQWNPITYSISYNANGGSGAVMASSSHTYDVAKNLTSNTYSAPTDKQFGGWNTQANGSGTSYSNGQSVKNLSSINGTTITLFAQWEAQSLDQDFYYGVALASDIPYLKASDQEALDDALAAGQIILGRNLNKATPKPVALPDTPGAAVFILPASFGEPIGFINASQRNEISIYTKTPVTFNGINYFLYSRAPASSVGYTLTIKYQ